MSKYAVVATYEITAQQIGVVLPLLRARYPRITKHFHRLCRHAAFAPGELPHLEKVPVKR